MKIRRFIGLYFLLPALFVQGCTNSNYVFYKDFPESVWLAEDTLRFNLTLSQKQVGSPFTIENTYSNLYPYQNIYLKIWAKSPSGKILESTLLDTLSNKAGIWRIKSKQGKYVLPFAAMDSLHLAEPGDYSFKIIQYMRKDSLRGIKKIGIKTTP